MKIGILTFHRAHNYGAVLQCYALQEVLKGFGHEVEVIDYRQPNIESYYQPYLLRAYKICGFSPLKLLIYLIKERPNRIKKKKIFDAFLNNYINISAVEDNVPDNLDLYIIGSDQMWSLDCVGGIVDNYYFGDFPKKEDAKVAGFSISTNSSSLEKLGATRLMDVSNRFSAISFREEYMAALYKEMTSIGVPVTLDPTLCAGADLWDNMIDSGWSKRSPYIVVYHVKSRFAPIVHTLILEQAQRLALANNLRVIDLSNGDYSIQDFVSAIKFSSCVLTTSFHATAFSIVFNRPLYSIKLHDGSDSRYVNLMDSLGMKEFVKDLDFKESEIPSIDYKTVNTKIDILRQPSLAYLSNILR